MQPSLGYPDRLVRPDRLASAGGWMFGEKRAVGAGLRWRWPAPPSPRQALEAVLLPLLRRPPCIVDFSGGRDSSLVLAVSTNLARREGLPLPVPLTRRFPGDDASDESAWQEKVVAHVGLTDWERVEAPGEFSLLSGRAQRFLHDYGPLFPAPLYVITASLEAARGGSHATGEGGDDVFSGRRAAFLRFVSDWRFLTRRPVRRAVAVQLAPRFARTERLYREYRRTSPPAGWLRPEPLATFARRLARQFASEPLDWRASLRWQVRQLATAGFVDNCAAIASDYDVAHADPLLAPSFVAALARVGGRFGFTSRGDAMEFVAGDLLPKEVLRRETKATFNGAYFTEVEREFARGWDGNGIDVDLVDPDALRSKWLETVVPAPSFGLLQQAWLAGQRPIHTQAQTITKPTSLGNEGSVVGIRVSRRDRAARRVDGDVEMGRPTAEGRRPPEPAREALWR